MDDRYDREERSYDRGTWGDSDPKDVPASGELAGEPR